MIIFSAGICGLSLGDVNKLRLNMSLELRDGKKVRFWEDAWLGHGPLRDRFPNKKLKLLQYAGIMGIRI